MFDNQKKTTISCRKAVIHSFYKSGSSRLETCRDGNSLLRSTVSGFTLIELLVVVLIIGILASVALPQYQVAVAKARFSTLKNLTKSIADAQELYYLENGKYADALADIVFSLPEGQDAASSTASRYTYTWGKCYLNGSELVACTNSQVNLEYQMYLTNSTRPGRRVCAALSLTDAAANRVCQSETGKKSADTTGTYYKTYGY